MSAREFRDEPGFELPVTNQCNNRCSFCMTGWQQDTPEARSSDVPRGALRERMTEAYQRGARRVTLHGGEPTSRRDLGEIVADARAIGFTQFTIFTNGRVAGATAGASWLVAMGVTQFSVSVQGGRAEAHDASVGAPGAFAQTVSGIRNLLAAGQRVCVNGVLTRHLLDTLADFARLMVELGPHQVGLDTVKPTGAFSPGRESYRALCPPLSPYAGALRDALFAMNDRGVSARVTSFPPCLLPGAENFVSEEPATSLLAKSEGRVELKRVWKRSMQVKPESCARCAYDAVCGGVYAPYAEAHGLSELRPVPPETGRWREGSRLADSPLTRSLRARLVRDARADQCVVREVYRRSDGSHQIECRGGGRAATVRLFARGSGPAAAETGRFRVVYVKGRDGEQTDLRVVEALVAWLRRAEGALPADAPPGP